MVVRRPDPAAFRAAVASVLGQTLSDLELIVVETPSDVAVAPLLAESEDGRLVHRVLPARTPLARARNAALALARAPFVGILDADDIAAPNRFERQVEFLQTHADIAVLGSALAVIAADGTPLGLRRYPEDHESIARAMRRYNAIAQPAVTARRAALEAVGGYAERAGGVCEDYDLWCRLLQSGARFANMPDALCSYRIHDDSMKATRLRDTLRDTISIKRAHFGAALDLGDRLRIHAERVLCWLPATLVRRLFLRRTICSWAPSTESIASTTSGQASFSSESRITSGSSLRAVNRSSITCVRLIPGTIFGKSKPDFEFMNPSGSMSLLHRSTLEAR